MRIKPPGAVSEIRTTRRLALAALLVVLPTSTVLAAAGQATATPPAAHTRTTTTVTAAFTGLDDPQKKDIAMQLVSSAENSSLDWRAQYTDRLVGLIADCGSRGHQTASPQ